MKTNCKIKTAIIVVAIMLTSLLTGFAAIQPVGAETATSAQYEIQSGEFDEYTNSEFLYNPDIGKNETTSVYNYKNHLSYIFKKDRDDSAVIDEWLLKAIPEVLFQNPGEYFYVGVKYGFYLKYEEDSDRYFYYLIRMEITDGNEIENERPGGHIIMNLKPLAYNYCKYDAINRKILPVETRFVIFKNGYWETERFSSNYMDIKRVYIKDVGFNAQLRNKNRANQGQDGYIAEEDNGQFFIGTDYRMNGSTLADATDILKFTLKQIIGVFGNIPKIGPLFWLGSTVWELIDQVPGFVASAKRDYKDSIQVGAIEDYLKIDNISKLNQLSAYNSLQKVAASGIETTMTDPYFLDPFFDDTYAECRFYINETDTWEAEFAASVNLSIVEENVFIGKNDDTCHEVVSITERVHSTPIKNIRRDRQESQDIYSNETLQCYGLNGYKTTYFFTARFTGEYTLSHFSDDGSSAKIKIVDVYNNETVGQSEYENNHKIRNIYLQQDRLYLITVENLSPNDYTAYKLKISFTPNELFLGSNYLTIDNESYMFASFTPDKYLYYNCHYPYPDFYGHVLFDIYVSEDLVEFIPLDMLGEEIVNDGYVDLNVLLEGQKTYYILFAMHFDISGAEIPIEISAEKHVYFFNAGFDDPLFIADESQPFEMPTPDDTEGRKFLGWKLNGGGDEYIDVDALRGIDAPDVYLEADWQYTDYEITFKEADGTLILTDTYTVIDSVTLPKPQKANHVFLGWYTNASFTGSKVNGWSLGQTGNRTYYAKWASAEYLINLDVNSDRTDGIAADIEYTGKTVNYDRHYNLPVPVSHSQDYIFDGWYLAQNVNGIWVETARKYTDENGNSLMKYTDEKDVTLIAKWRKEQIFIQIKYYNNGVSGAYSFKCLSRDANGNPVLTSSATPIEFEAGLCPNCWVTANKSAVYRTGYIFRALLVDESGQITTDNIACWHSIPKVITDNEVVQLYLLYEKEFHHLRFSDFSHNELPAIGVDYGTSISLPRPNKEGYTFSHWVVSDCIENDSVKSAFRIGSRFTLTSMPDLSVNSEGSGEIYLTAVFNPVTVKIEFNAVHCASPSGTTVKYDSNPRFAYSLTTAGRVFKGWEYNGVLVTDSSGNLINAYPYIIDGVWKILPENGNLNIKITLKAVWESLVYDLILENADGSGERQIVRAEFDNIMPNNISGPARLGYDFKGYFTEENGSGVQYYNEFLIGAKHFDVAGSLTLYAYWIVVEYKVTLCWDYTDKWTPSIFSTVIKVSFGQQMPTNIIHDDNIAPIRSGYDFKGFYTGHNGLGEKYYGGELKRYDNISWYVFLTSLKTWDRHSNDTILYADWTPLSGSRTIEYFSGSGKTLATENVLLTMDTTKSFVAKEFLGCTFKYWLVVFGDEYSLPEYYPSSFNLYIDYMYRDHNGAVVSPSINCFYDGEESNCIAEGTLITLADGTQKAVETLTGDEMLLAWNLHTGTFEAAPILFIDSDPRQDYEVINLHFSDGTKVKVISEHGFWDFDLNRYVMLDNTAAQYIGHWFNKQTIDKNGNMIWERVQLKHVKIKTEYTTSWSPVTYGHLCYYVNGMLSMPGGVTGLINIFDVDAQTMTINQVAYEADIEMYGLFTYEEFAEVLPVPEIIFEAFGGQYLKVAIGKGLITWEQLGRLIERYAEFF